MTEQERLAAFIVEYVSELDAQMDRLGGRAVFGVNYGAAHTILCIEASDGFATFYIPEGERGRMLGPLPAELGPGFNLIKSTDRTMNEVCQELSFRQLRMIARQLGSPLTLGVLPADVPLQPAHFRFSLLSGEFRGAIAEANAAPPTIALSPIYNVADGIVRRLRPTRGQLWCPWVRTTTGRARPIYAWTHADFWWDPSALPLERSAKAVAKADALALRVLVDEPASHPSGRGSPETAAEVLERKCGEFESLLDQHRNNEAAIHAWLARRENHIFLHSEAREIRSKVRFGKHVSDFVIRRTDDNYVLCEIEQPDLPLFIQNGEASARLNHAVTQVRDWQQYVRDNVRTVRAELDLPNIDAPSGMAVAGRAAQFAGDAEAERRWRDMKAQGHHGVELHHYDDLIDRVRQLAANLKEILRTSG